MKLFSNLKLMNEYLKNYYEKNKNKISNQKKFYYEKNKEKIKEYQKNKYVKKNRKKLSNEEKKKNFKNSVKKWQSQKIECCKCKKIISNGHYDKHLKNYCKYKTQKKDDEDDNKSISSLELD